MEPLRSTWKEKGVTIVSDGWSDPTRKPLINFMATSANCKAAGQLIESQFPHIYWTPCVVHTLNLAVKNICSPMARWVKNKTPLHYLAHSLNPRYYSDEWLLEDSTRSAPHRDAEISQERMKCFRRLFPNNDEHSIVLDEYAMFSMKSGFFSDLTSISMMGTMEPKSWWVNFGAQTPFLQTLAFRLLGQPSSSFCAERNWSAYTFIHSLRRNKLTTSRAQDLVYIHNNLRILSRNPNDDVKMWDVGGDAFDSMEDVGFLEFANLSLD
nr:hAT dimerization domain, ribonuclease H-like domain protein [Tanacetum cinerariifolium]